MNNTTKIVINWHDPESIKAAEKKKTELENNGYSLIFENAFFFSSILIYRKQS